MSEKTKTDELRAKNVGLKTEQYKRLAEQVKSEITNSQSFMSPAWEIRRKRIKLFNNQKKDVSAVSDPMLFTHFQTVLAALYEDKLKTVFAPRKEVDTIKAENLNPLYEYDYVDMDKAIVDYKSIWNSLFFGRSLTIMSQWDRILLCPKPEVVNMLTWHRDPKATSVNGDSEGRGSMRFGGRPIYMTIEEFRESKVYFNLDELGSSENSELKEAQAEIDSAQGVESVGDVSGDNKTYTIMEWWTKFAMEEKNEKTGEMEKKVKRVLVGMQNGLIVRFTILKDQDEWGIIDKAIYPDAISWDGVNIPDIIEDKQRANARVLNAALFNVESNAHQMGLYDATKIKKQSHLNYGHNKNIPINGSVAGAYEPIQRPQIGQEVSYIMDTLKDLAQRATGATEIQQGAVAGTKRTATEIATVSEGADTRFSLSAKIFGWSERAFARYWYKMYKMYFTDAINEKVVRVNGLIGFFWKPLKREDIIGETDPEVKVESKIVSEARRLRGLQNFTNAYPILASDPTTNKEFLSREWARLNGYNTMQMKMLFKESPDRIIAREENEKMAKGEDVDISFTDDDYTHIDEHQRERKAVEHVKAHFEQLVAKAKNPQIQGEVQEMEQQLNPQPVVDTTNINFNAPKTLQTA